MKAFEEWWQAWIEQHSELHYRYKALHYTNRAARAAWFHLRKSIYYDGDKEITCYCGDIYSPDVNLNACIVIQETGYCPNCIAMEMREYKK